MPPVRPLHFAIIVPTHNRPDGLARCLDSIARLRYPRTDFEVIIVDDGSHVSVTPTIDDARRRHRLDVTLVRQDNAGPAAARNTGAARARARYLAFTDDDCEVDPEWLTNLERQIGQRGDAMVGGRTVNRLGHNVYSTASQLIVDSVYAFYNSDADAPRFFATSNMAVPLRQFLELGGFNAEVFSHASEDRDLCQRWLDRGWALAYAGDAVVHHSHALRFWSFCRQHFTYGRGAYCFARAHLRHKRLHSRRPFRFHANPGNWLFRPFKDGLPNPGVLTAALMVWQVANLCGYLWQFATRASRMGPAQ